MASIRYLVDDVDASIEFYPTPGGGNRFVVGIDDLERTIEALVAAGKR